MVAYTFIFFISSDATVILKRFRLHYSISLLVRLGIIAQPFSFFLSECNIYNFFIFYKLCITFKWNQRGKTPFSSSSWVFTVVDCRSSLESYYVSAYKKFPPITSLPSNINPGIASCACRLFSNPPKSRSLSSVCL